MDEIIHLKSLVGVPLWLSRLKVWRCHCRGVGSIPGLETWPCQKKKKRKELSAYDVCSINCGRDDDNDGIDGSGPER